MYRLSIWNNKGLAVVGIMLAVLTGCSKETSFTVDDIPTGYRFKADTLLAVASDWANRGGSAGSSYLSKRLVAGSGEGPRSESFYLSRTFLLFLSLPDSTVDVTSAQIFLYATGVRGDGACGSFDIHTLADTLYQTTLYWGNMPEPDPEPVASFTAPQQNGDSILIDVTDAVTSWVKNENDNLGFVIKSDEMTDDFCLIEFASREVPRTEDISDGDTTTYEFRPALRIAYIDTAGEAQFSESIASADAFADTLVLSGTPEGMGSSLVCGNGFPSRAFVKFDVLKVPIEASVTKAILSLSLDPEGSAFDSIGVICHAVLDPEWTGFDTQIGASGAGSKVLKLDDPGFEQTVTMDISGLIHPLIARKVSNYGLVIKSMGETSDLDFVRFFDGSSPDSSLHPTLRIDYLMPPRPPYSEEQ